jgi:hypothetical protein
LLSPSHATMGTTISQLPSIIFGAVGFVPASAIIRPLRAPLRSGGLRRFAL